MDNSALVPALPELDAEPIKAVEQVANNQAINEAKELASLNGSGGWNKIAESMKADIEKLRNMRGVDVAGKDFAEIGQKFLVASFVADHLQKYLDNVENAVKAVIEHERATKPK